MHPSLSEAQGKAEMIVLTKFMTIFISIHLKTLKKNNVWKFFFLKLPSWQNSFKQKYVREIYFKLLSEDWVHRICDLFWGQSWGYSPNWIYFYAASKTVGIAKTCQDGAPATLWLPANLVTSQAWRLPGKEASHSQRQTQMFPGLPLHSPKCLHPWRHICCNE